MRNWAAIVYIKADLDMANGAAERRVPTRFESGGLLQSSFRNGKWKCGKWGEITYEILKMTGHKTTLIVDLGRQKGWRILGSGIQNVQWIC